MASECPFMLSFWQAILTRKVGRTELVFAVLGVQSGLISRSVHARVQVSVCSSYSLNHSLTQSPSLFDAP